MSEVWQPVVGYDGFYEVSDAGRVRSIDRVFIRADGQREGRRGRVLTPTPAGSGYPSVTLRLGRRRTIHILVCEAFHGARPTPSHEVAHFDGDKTNNCADNLRWATHSENVGDSHRLGTFRLPPGEGGERNGFARLTWPVVDAIRAQWTDGSTQAALAIRHGVSKTQVHNIVRGKQWNEAWRV